MTKTKAELDASIQEKIEADADFQTSLDGLSDDDKNQKLEERKAELFDQELSGLNEKAEKLTKAEELANNYKIRAEKAEKAKEKKDETPIGDNLTPKDYLALTENKISSEDFDEVVRVAKILGKPISDALKDKTLQSIIADRVEERATALATQTKSPRGTSKVSGEALIDKAEKGNLPESEIDELVKANMERKLKK